MKAGSSSSSKARVAQPADGSADGDVRQQPAAAVQRLQTDARRRLAGDARQPAGVWAAVDDDLDLTPWSTPFTADISPTATFEINEGCFAPQFNPSFVAGTTNIQAGEYSPFTLSFGRRIRSSSSTACRSRCRRVCSGLWPGPAVSEPQAAQGTCGEESLIGHTQVLTGPGRGPVPRHGRAGVPHRKRTRARRSACRSSCPRSRARTRSRVRPATARSSSGRRSTSTRTPRR